MRRTKRWLHAGALTIVLIMVWASPPWALEFDYTQMDRYNNLGTKVYSLMTKGKYQEAVKPAEQLLKLTEKLYADEPDHDNVEVALNSLAIIYMGLGRYDEAEPLFKRVLAIDEKLGDPNNLEVAMILNNLALLYAAQDRDTEAERYHKRALAIREEVFGPQSQPAAQSLRNLARLYNKTGRDDEAEPLRKRALAIYEKALGPNHPTVAALRVGKATTPYGKGVDYANKGQYDAAIASYKEAIRLKPDYAKAHNNLGVAYDEKGLYDDAIAAYKEAIRLKPDYAYAHNNLGVAYGEKGQYDAAIASYKEAVRLKPDYALAHRNLGDAYRKKGQHDAAIASYKEALRLNPDAHAAYFGLGYAYDDKGLYDDAIAMYKEAIRLKPDYARAHIDLANLYKKQGQHDKAETVYKRALRSLERINPFNPNGATLLEKMVKFYREMGRDDEAKKLLARAKRSAIMEKEGVRLKAHLTSGVDKGYPIDDVTTFNVNENERMYFYGYWTDIVGAHRVTVKWIRPDKKAYAENIYDTNFSKNKTKRIWLSQKIFKNMPRGVWTSELYLDGKHFFTKKFTVEPKETDQSKKLLVRAKGDVKRKSESGEKAGKITTSDLIHAVEEKEGIRFKVIMTSGLGKNNEPIDFKTSFSVRDGGKMYVFIYWFDMVGDHSVTVKWIKPDQKVFDEETIEMEFKEPDWKTWAWPNPYKHRPTGDWTFELHLDGKHLVTKKFTVTR